MAKLFVTYEEALEAAINACLNVKANGGCPDNDWGEEYSDENNENI